MLFLLPEEVASFTAMAALTPKPGPHKAHATDVGLWQMGLSTKSSRTWSAMDTSEGQVLGLDYKCHIWKAESSFHLYTNKELA